MKNKAIWITSGAIVLIAAVVYFLMGQGWPFKKKGSGDTDKPGGNGTAAKKISLGSATFPLKKGSEGVEVLYYQAFLNKYKGADIVMLDGIWGNETNRNSKEFNGQRTEITLQLFNLDVYPKRMILKAYLATKGITL